MELVSCHPFGAENFGIFIQPPGSGAIGLVTSASVMVVTLSAMYVYVYACVYAYYCLKHNIYTSTQ